MKQTAPGKLFLVGEYAVLEGAPALLTTVPQRASVSLTAAAQPTVVSLTHETQTLTLDTALQQLTLLAAVVEQLDAREQLDGHELRLDTAEFFRNVPQHNRNIKLGLGSSAALTAALVKCLLPTANRKAQLAAAIDCHKRFQSGKGSGADIALSITDQSIVFEMSLPPEPITLPSDLHLLAIWSGAAASTTGFLSAMDAWKSDHATTYADCLQALSETAINSTNAISDADTAAFVKLYHQYDRQLDNLSRISGVHFYNEPHEMMRKKVESAHCAYKPSGAGGGDFGIACSTNENDLISLANTLDQSGNYCFLLNQQSTEFQEK